MVPDAWNPESCRHSCRLAPGALLLKHVEWITTPADRRQHQAQHLISTATAPPEQPVREGVIRIPGQLVGTEPLNAGSCRHRWQPGTEPEAVRQPGQVVRPFREDAIAEVLAKLELLPERGTADQNAIGFHPGTVDRLPSPSPTGRTDGIEQNGTVLLQPGVKGWR